MGGLRGAFQAEFFCDLLQQGRDRDREFREWCNEDRERSQREFREWHNEDHERSQCDVECIVDQHQQWMEKQDATHQEWLRQHENIFNFNIWVITFFFAIFVVSMPSLH